MQGIPDDPPRGLKARFYEGMAKRPPRFRSSTYRALVIFGYIAAGVEFTVVSLMYRETADVVPVLEGLCGGAVFGFLVIFSDASFFRGRPRLEALVLLTVMALTYVWLDGYVRDRLDTREGELTLTGFMMGWTLSWALSGNLYVGYKRMLELDITGPPRTRADVEAEARKAAEAILAEEEQRLGRCISLVFCAVLLIGTSAGIMVYGALGMIADPDANDLHTAEDWSGMVVWLVPICASLAVLAVGLLRMQARIMMFAGVLAAFSYLGIFAVLGQAILWVAHRRFGLPWGGEDVGPAGEDTPTRLPPEDPAVRRALEQLLKEREVVGIRDFRRMVAKNASRFGVILDVDVSPPTSILDELRLAERDLETIEEALEDLVGKDPEKYGEGLDEVQGLLDQVLSMEVSEETRLGLRSERDLT